MAYKNETSRLPIPPKDARVQTAVCHYCIVGCGYKVYSWDVNRQGGTAPGDNAFGADLSKQQGAETGNWFAPSMYNIVKQDGRETHLVIKPDTECVVNSGLGSIRGARMGSNSYSRVTGTQAQRLTDPLVWRYSGMFPTSWTDALDLVAEVTRRVVEEQGEDGLIVSCYDHGGAGGGYENTWATGKLYFESMKVRNIRIHNRPAYNSEVHATRDMGVGELNNAYEDAELCDTLFAVGTNPLETQTNYFLNHWVANLRGTSLDKKKKLMPGEPHGPARIVFVDPRRTVSVNAAEVEAGKDNVLHLALESGTDLALFNALFTYIVDKGWIDKEFVANSTLGAPAPRPPLFPARGAAGSAKPGHLTSLADAVEANRLSIDDAAKITGLKADDIVKAAHWIAEPKEGGHRRRVMFGYEKGLIWGNDNYRTNGALVNLALATGNVGRPGGGCVRLGGHQEGYVRPSDAFIGRPAPYVDQLLLQGRGGIHHVWGCDHFKTTLNADAFRRMYRKRTNMVKEAMSSVPAGDRDKQLEAIMAAIRQGGLFSVDIDIVPSRIGESAHVVLPAATSGEMNLTSMNGERRMRITERYMDPPGQAKPDCMIVAELAHALERSWTAAGKPEIAKKFKGYDWNSEEDAFMDGYQKHAAGGEFVTYERLRAMGTNGFQEPATGLDGDRIVGTDRLYTNGVFSSEDGKARFLAGPWRGLEAAGKQEEKDKYRFLVNNGRTNHVWQSAYLDQQNKLVEDRWPLAFIQMNPEDMKELGVNAGDLVEVTNDNGSTQAMAYPTPTAKRNETFMVFGYPPGVQGLVVSAGVNELVIPNYKQTWGDIRKLADAPEVTRHLSFKSQEYRPA